MDGAAPNANCPRCGYDQSGIIAAWADVCPLEGVCSECGLEVRWEEILSPKFAPPAWSFEHTPRPSASRFFRTHARATVVPSFWRGLRLEHGVVAQRLIMAMIAWIVMCHLMVSVVSGVRIYRQGSAALAKIPFPVVAPGSPAPTVRSGPVRRRPTPGFGFGPIPTRKQATDSLWSAVLQGTLWPYGVERITPASLGIIRFRSVVPRSFGELLFFAAMIPPGFLVLGDTFRKCRVRFVHLVRGTAYSLSLPAMAAVVCLLGASFIEEVPWTLVSLVCALWLCVYWVLFVRVYLRLTHAGWVAAAMLTISGLSTLILMVLLWITRMGGW